LPTIFRISSNRKNIRYSIRFQLTYNNILSIIREKNNFYSTSRLIIYIRTREVARQLNNILKYEYYYSNSPDRQRVLSNFLDGKIRVIIATSSLGLGLDLSNIRLIIYIDKPYTLYDYA